MFSCFSPCRLSVDWAFFYVFLIFALTVLCRLGFFLCFLDFRPIGSLSIGLFSMFSWFLPCRFSVDWAFFYVFLIFALLALVCWAFFYVFLIFALSALCLLGFFLCFLDFCPAGSLLVGLFSMFSWFLPCRLSVDWAFFYIFSIFALPVLCLLGFFLCFLDFCPADSLLAGLFSRFSRLSPCQLYFLYLYFIVTYIQNPLIYCANCYFLMFGGVQVQSSYRASMNVASTNTASANDLLTFWPRYQDIL